MQPELLFFAVVIVWGIAFRNRSEVISWFSNRLYVAWFLLSISNYDYTPSALQYGLRLLAMGVGILAVFGDGTIKFYLPRKASTATLFVIYLGYCAVTTIWSVDPLQTIVKVVELFVDILVISKAFEVDGVDLAVKKFIKILVTVCVLLEFYSILGFFLMNGTFFHTQGGVIGRQLTGVIASSDALCAAMVLVICYYLNFRKGILDNVILGLSFVVLFLGQARTSIACAMVVVLVYFFRTNKKAFYAGLMAVLAVLAYLNWDTVYAYLVRGQSEANLQSFTGRKTMWSWAEEYIAKRPLLGYGYGSGGEMVSMRIDMSSLHSGIYETLMGVGYIGFVQLALIYALVVIKVVLNTIAYGFSENMYEIMLVIYFTIFTYMGVGIGGWQGMTMLFFLTVVFGFSYKGKYNTLTMRCENTYAGDVCDEHD